MITVFIGHRGVGKTSLLKRVKVYVENAITIDLDKHIEEMEGQSIQQIFSKKGITHFRTLEADYFTQLMQKYKNDSAPVYIALGAGFNFKLPDDAFKVFVKRATDSLGRSFLHRPRLQDEKSPLAEYLSLFDEREKNYQFQSDIVYSMPEGITGPTNAERDILLKQVRQVRADFTLLPEHFDKKENLLRIKSMGFRRFEVRDDLLTLKQIEEAIEVIGAKNILYSFRDVSKIEQGRKLHKKVADTDWALELGDVENGIEPTILSLHERLDDMEATIKFLMQKSPSKNCILKLAVEVNDFSELAIANQWQAEDEKQRALLPRSQNGRWAWYRLLLKKKSPINFIRENEGSSEDQPTLFDWLHFNESNKDFAAIFGDPVLHSASPMEHNAYCSKRGMNFLKILCSKKEFSKDNLEFLKSIGLKWAAVTSPLKLEAYLVCSGLTAKAKKLKSVNTICYTGEKLIGHNTDHDGLMALQAHIDNRPLVIWGGGGTLQPLKEIFPEAICFSARTGIPREGEFVEENFPKQIIWASGEKGVKPPKDWPIELVVDLSYSENSLGKELAAERNIKYVSGKEMFKVQAAKQREFLDECESLWQ